MNCFNLFYSVKFTLSFGINLKVNFHTSKYFGKHFSEVWDWNDFGKITDWYGYQLHQISTMFLWSFLHSLERVFRRGHLSANGKNNRFGCLNCHKEDAPLSGLLLLRSSQCCSFSLSLEKFKSQNLECFVAKSSGMWGVLTHIPTVFQLRISRT